MTIVYEKDGRGVVTVTMNQPDKHNAFDDQVIAQLQAAFDKASADSSVRALVLAAEGKSFSAGADLAWMQRMASYSLAENRRDADALAKMLFTLNHLPFPTLAKVQGAAFGGAVGAGTGKKVYATGRYRPFGENLDDATNGIGAINRPGRPAQNLDPFNGRQGDAFQGGLPRGG